MRELDRQIALEVMGWEAIPCANRGKGYESEHGATAPLAICKAALEAVRGEQQ